MNGKQRDLYIAIIRCFNMKNGVPGYVCKVLFKYNFQILEYGVDKNYIVFYCFKVDDLTGDKKQEEII